MDQSPFYLHFKITQYIELYSTRLDKP